MLLEGKKGLVLNVTNKRSIGWAIADLANREGALVGLGAQNERLLENATELVEGRERFETVTIDFAFEEQFASLREQVETKVGKLDFIVHSAAYAPREALENRFIETTREQFEIAMNASVYSLFRTCRELEPLLNDDASIVALTYLGSTRAMKNYNVMGVCKAALEASVRYLALDLGERGIRVNAVSPGPIRTAAASGISGLKDMIRHVGDTAPLKRPYGQEEAAGAAVYFLSDLSKGITGQILFVDSGYSVVAM
ncbi:enoyl-ACP reductase FabI [Fimbriimonas ginsengisoli]|uniref:Enoyl-[acyl-carrier-protein] reductase [NADH] n=1 Tax=Fimbriimonas ginsengisoli Gsoil 348 TaxID=661478 RepID=A0A068NVM5_FIMGI|nr:enoyl-ACP reductase [Fimbriimonas ginsengisoli]AIE85634.1 enoyl-(acyl carrier protein) reductase [Fimbriimonas ginsengisoli Gsoil 348]